MSPRSPRPQRPAVQPPTSPGKPHDRERQAKHARHPLTTTSPAPLTEYDQQQLRGECKVFDRTGGLTLIFTGRHTFPGIELGSQIRATGTIGETTGRLTITDPAYQILAG
jgi:hypothetical protein